MNKRVFVLLMESETKEGLNDMYEKFLDFLSGSSKSGQMARANWIRNEEMEDVMAGKVRAAFANREIQS